MGPLLPRLMDERPMCASSLYPLCNVRRRFISQCFVPTWCGAHALTCAVYEAPSPTPQALSPKQKCIDHFPSMGCSCNRRHSICRSKDIMLPFGRQPCLAFCAIVLIPNYLLRRSLGAFASLIIDLCVATLCFIALLSWRMPTQHHGFYPMTGDDGPNHSLP